MKTLTEFILENIETKPSVKISTKGDLLTIKQIKQAVSKITPETNPEITESKNIKIVSTKKSWDVAPALYDFTFNNCKFDIESRSCFRDCTFKNCEINAEFDQYLLNTWSALDSTQDDNEYGKYKDTFINCTFKSNQWVRQCWLDISLNKTNYIYKNCVIDLDADYSRENLRISINDKSNNSKIDSILNKEIDVNEKWNEIQNLIKSQIKFINNKKAIDIKKETYPRGVSYTVTLDTK